MSTTFPIVIENEFVRLKVSEEYGGWISQEIFAKTGMKDGARLMVVGERSDLKSSANLSDHRDVILLADGEEARFRLTGKPRASHGAKGHLEIQGAAGPHDLILQFTLAKGSKWLHVKVEDRIKGTSAIETLESSYSFVPGGKTREEILPLDFCWVPNLRPKEDEVIGDHVFRSPTVIVQKGTSLVALVPDLDLLAKNRKMMTVFDFNLRPPKGCGPTFGYGFKEYKPLAHVFYRHDGNMTKTLANETLTYGYDLLIDGEANRLHGFQQVPRFLWQRYAEKYTKRIEPQVLPFAQYARRGYDCMFKQYDIWREEEFGGRRIGGTVWRTWDGDPKEGREPEIKNQTWFNNLRVAYGMYHYGLKWGDKDLTDKATKMKNLALSAPSEKGIFATSLSVKHGELKWFRGTRAQDNSEYYHTADDAWTAFWMLQWYRDFEQDQDLLGRAKQLGDFFVGSQLASGAIPSWVQIKDGKVEAVPPLEESATTGCPAFFLVELHNFIKQEKYLEAAEKAARFILGNIVPENKWFDFEQYFTACARKPGLRCEYTGLWGHNTMSLWWATEMFARLYDTTGKSVYLETGKRLLDTLCLYQQIWNPPYLSFYAFGGFGVMNSDAEWSDARQSMFASTLMHYYILTGEDEYFLRGIAALRASFALMLIPENKNIAPGNVVGMKPKDFGATYENYGHFGDDRKVPGYIMFDWGSGSSASAAAYIERRYGDIYVDSRRRKGFGVNGCIVDRVVMKAGKLVSLEIKKRMLKPEDMVITVK